MIAAKMVSVSEIYTLSLIISMETRVRGCNFLSRRERGIKLPINVLMIAKRICLFIV